MNKVEIMGKVSHLETIYQEINGENILVLRFALEVAREGSKTQIDLIPVRVTGTMAEYVTKDIKNGDKVSIKGRWNVDNVLSPNGEIIRYCTCIPQVLIVQENKQRGDDLLIR